ncbi:MAG: hypothetical protein AAB074_07490 [Planctomycetota bacterium]
MNAPAPAAARQLFHCEFCDAPLRDFMVFCPRCSLRLDAGQLALRRANVLLGEAGSWCKSGDLPSEIAERMLDKYRTEYGTAMTGLIARSPKFRSGAVPVANAVAPGASTPAAAASVVLAPPAAAPEPVEVPKPAENPPGWVTIPVDPAPPVAAAPVVLSTEPEDIPAAAPVEVVSMGADGRPRFAAPRHSAVRPQEPQEDLLFGVLSERHLNVLASVGIFAVFVAVVLLVYKGWEGYAAASKVGMIAAAAGASMGLGALLRSKTVLKTTGNALFVLGTLSTPIVFAAAAWYDLFSISDSVLGVAGAASSAALYAWLGRKKEFAYFSWLACASVIVGHGFLLDLCGVTGHDLAPGYGLLGAALAVLAARTRRKELEVSAGAVLIGSMIACVPLVIWGQLSPGIGLVGALAMCGGFVAMSAIHPLWMHGAWLAAGGASLAACRASHATWPAWPGGLAVAGALSLAGALKKHVRTEPLVAGGAALLLVAGIMCGMGYGSAKFPLADQALLFFAIVATPALAVTAWKRNEEPWALVSMVLPGAAFFAIRRLLELPVGWLPVGLGAYAAALYAFGRGTNVFARAATPVAIFSHVVAFLVCCYPGAAALSFLDADAARMARAIPHFWGDFAWRGAFAMLLPGLAILFARVRPDPHFLYGAQPSLLAALVFSAHALHLPGEWMTSLVAGASLAVVLATVRLEDVFRGPVRIMGGVAAVPAAIAGFVFWAQPEGATSLAASGALAVALGLFTSVEIPIALGAALLAASWASTSEIMFVAPRFLAVGALEFVPAAAASLVVQDAKKRIAALAGVGLVCSVEVMRMLARPDSWSAPGAALPALTLGLLAATSLALGFREKSADEPQEPAAWSGIGALLAMAAGGFVVLQIGVGADSRAAACAVIPAALVIAGALRLKSAQGLPWIALGSAGVLLSVAWSFNSGFASAAAATAVAAVPAMLLAFTGPSKEIASATGAGLLSISAGCLAHAAHVRAPWLAPACALVPVAFALAGRARFEFPQGRPWLFTGTAGLALALILGATGSSLEFAIVAAIAAVPAFALSCYGPEREGTAAAFAALAAASAAAFAHNMHLPAAWIPVACAAVPASLVALGAYAHFLPQGKPWAATSAAALAIALSYSLVHGPLSFAVTALICAGAAGSAIRFAPATLAGVAALLFNASVTAFLIHAGLDVRVAAPLLVSLASMEALAASLAGSRTASHSVFAAAGALAFSAVVWAFVGPRGGEVHLLPGMISLGIAAVAASVAAIIRRQPYLWAVTACAGVAEFYLALRHFDVTTLEAYTFPPAIALIAWSHFATRRTATVVPDAPHGPVVEAVLSDWARRQVATLHEQIGSVRLLAILGALVPTVFLALPSSEVAHLPYALGGSAAVLVAGVLARRKAEAVAGICGLGGLVVVKAIEWMVEQQLSAAWWILVVGAALIGFVAVFEVRRSWYLKGKGEAVRKVVEAYLAKWR